MWFGWLPTDVMAQQVGDLDRIADARREAELDRQERGT